ncbi:undecaprenyl-phosphate glucose phosphotransferase [Halothiobacillus sp.]|uniref:undecaprenyl-phosphate glucose phosphotransferase n=1 Tax=Halothiobacillus sp. TaxID=1891311 RepID=UPI002AD23A96|nr:undecaprenyl-phosphate glucose phosphotransferase [Halothiobacillus sp.]
MKTSLLRPHSPLISVATRVLDVILVVLAGVGAFWLRFSEAGLSMPVAYGALLLIAGLLAAVVFPMLGVYRSWRARGLMAPGVRALGAWSLVFFLLLTLLLLAKQGETYSRLWLVLWWGVTGLLLVGLRTIIFSFLRAVRRRGYNRRKAVLVGCGPSARNLYERAEEMSWAGFEVVAIFGDGDDCALKGISPRPVEELWDYVEQNLVDEIWIAVPLEESARLRDVLERLHCSTANVRYVPDLFGLILLNHGVSEILDMPMIDLTSSPMTGVNRLVKAIEDRVLAFVILVMISPLMLAIALGIKLTSSGPIFFRQTRLGWDGKEFEIYKFRSMVEHREQVGEVTQAQKNDPRVTRLGAFLRRTSLDELPQFINVLQGRMSIVGPRPHAIEHNEMFKNLIEGYMLRHKVKPGITGWAQVNGWRGETDTLEKMQRRIEYDLYYIENWSLIFDFKIIVMTVFRGFAHENAY